MYSITIRDHIMIAHSLPDDFFGPAAKLHGATYMVDVEFMKEELEEHQVVMDIGLAQKVLEEVLEPINYNNLDEFPQFKGKLTTTEYLARYIHDQVKKAAAEVFQGSIRVTLHESHVASATYQETILNP